MAQKRLLKAPTLAELDSSDSEVRPQLGGSVIGTEGQVWPPAIGVQHTGMVCRVNVQIGPAGIIKYKQG